MSFFVVSLSTKTLIYLRPAARSLGTRSPVQLSDCDSFQAVAEFHPLHQVRRLSNCLMTAISQWSRQAAVALPFPLHAAQAQNKHAEVWNLAAHLFCAPLTSTHRHSLVAPFGLWHLWHLFPRLLSFFNYSQFPPLVNVVGNYVYCKPALIKLVQNLLPN